MNERALHILDSYFGITKNEDGSFDDKQSISWPLPGDESRTAPYTLNYVLNGYQSAKEYRQHKKAIEDSNFDARSRNHFLMLSAAMLAATDPEKIDEILG